MIFNRTTAYQFGALAALFLACSSLFLTCSSLFGEEGNDRPFGIDNRIPWTTSQITGSPEPPSPYRIERVFPHLEFTDPVVLTSAPGTERLFVVQLDGKVFSFPNENTCDKLDLFVDLAAEVDKLDKVYGLTFHPQFADNRYCYICYITEPDIPGGSRVSRFRVADTNPPTLDSSSEKVILTWLSGGHNGGCLKFGPEGYLYITTGDGGPAFPPDPRKSGQDVSTLLSSVLRIDVDQVGTDRAYSIPSDNPFVDLPGARGEIWAYGFRNPWKISFDPDTGDLWLGDVGWELWELVYRVERAANYGWSLVEGPQPVHRERERGPTPIVPPTVAHSHIEARSITGGIVYRGDRLPDLAGAYVYGDYVTGKMWAARHDGQQVASLQELVDTTIQIVCFGTDHNHELFVVGYDGTIHRLVRNPATDVNRDFPSRLSDTGLFDSTKQHHVAAGVVPYSVNAEPWMDGAVAQRYVALPNTSTLGIYDSSNVQIGYIKGRWRFPTDSVLLKTISLEMESGNPDSLRHLETQILHFDVDTWRGYSYLWNDEQTDAVLAEQGSDRTFSIVDPATTGGKRQQTWHFSSRTECLLCHTTRGGSIYGFNPAQLNMHHDYGEITDNQLRTFKHIGLFDTLADSPSDRMVNPHDEQADLTERARAYLHLNCAHCHRRGGGGTAAIDVQYQLSLQQTNLLDSRPTQGTFGIHGAQVFAPGDPYRSVLYYRMSKLGRGRMPYIGSNLVDIRGLKLIHDWIGQTQGGSTAAADSVSSVSRGMQREALFSLNSKPADDAQQTGLITQLLSTTSGSMMLLSAMNEGALSDATSEQAIAAGLAHTDIQVRDLFERFLPEDQRPQRLGQVVDPQDILRLSGNAVRGEQLFANAAGVQCRSCHRIGNVGKQLGPDLGPPEKQRTRDQLLESILQPSKDIDPRYVAQLVETSDGRVVVGLRISNSKDAEQVVLRDAQGKDVSIAASDVELMAPQQKSLMPELLVQDLTAQEVSDLLEFLVQQRPAGE